MLYFTASSPIIVDADLTLAKHMQQQTANDYNITYDLDGRVCTVKINLSNITNHYIDNLT